MNLDAESTYAIVNATRQGGLGTVLRSVKGGSAVKTPPVNSVTNHHRVGLVCACIKT